MKCLLHPLVKHWPKLAVLAAISATMTSCFYAYTETNGNDPDGSYQWRGNGESQIPPDLMLVADVCELPKEQREKYKGQHELSCFKDHQQTWIANCRGDDCRAVTAFVHYMLEEDLGNSNAVIVEAFDNPKFVGSPISQVTIQGFTANRAGDFKQTKLYLSPGSYYLRAYISNEDEALTPYSYGGMEMVRDRPIGVYGALSRPHAINVTPSSYEASVEPVHISLDLLFKKPGVEQPTNAYVRLKLSTQDLAAVTAGRKIVIQLHEDMDLMRIPLEQFQVASEQWLVEGRKGMTEFVSPSLATRDYVVFVFLDADGNGYYDEGELAQIYQVQGQPGRLAVHANRTATVSLELVNNPRVPGLSD